ncbi:unnamed protein product [Mycena citricolor]|uniref:Cystathionine gamma-synthase n=1 Tax=Mycena citricolor TaxID=2018698 RepID=A0AAD2GWG9_9AGAR|nr:unnamed protein product [Mycena citricolor]
MNAIPQPTPSLGRSIPADSPYSLLWSLPDWEHNVIIAEGKRDTFEWKLETAYPRFGTHPRVAKLVAIVSAALDPVQKRFLLLFPCRQFAEELRHYMQQTLPSASCDIQSASSVANPPPGHEIYAAFLSVGRSEIMSFHIFSGTGISPRLADVCLQRLEGIEEPALSPVPDEGHLFSHYYKRHAPLSSVAEAKKAIRTRFSGVLEDGTSIRGVSSASPEDVYLYPAGMHAVWRVNQLISAVLGSTNKTAKVAHVNMLYADSYRILELPDNPGYDFFSNNMLDELEVLLESGTPDSPAILAVMTDLPGNPHIETPDLERLRRLADKYNFAVVVDETIAGHLNVQALPYCDIVVASLSKLFSGLANVQVGAIMLNPDSPFYSRFKMHLQDTYRDYFFDQDALILEMNSREFVERTAVVNRNAEAAADALFSRSLAGGATNSVLQTVLYPKYRSRENYDRVLNLSAAKAGLADPGYSYLLSPIFTSLEAAKAFYESLQCSRGATLGTVFTLATAFSALAFPPDKREWMQAHGVEPFLVCSIPVFPSDLSMFRSGTPEHWNGRNNGDLTSLI